jgi:hypothetical protein
METDKIPVHEGEPGGPYRVVGEIKAKVGAATVFSKTPTLEDVNFKLREQAAKLGANAVVQVQYKRGVIATSWKGMTATGVAVVMESDERPCPVCAESIKRAAIKCRFCGAEVQPV